LAEQGVTEQLYAHVAEHGHPEYSDAEQVAIEYAEKFALDHLSIDEAFFDRLHAHFSDADILDLTICIATFVALGRTLNVLGIETTELTDVNYVKD